MSSSDGGIKYDVGKSRLDLIDPLALHGLGSVLAFGATKYNDHNWRKRIANSRIMASLLHHLMAIQAGEYVDNESGMPHIDHVGANWMFLSNNLKTRPDLNDLWKGKLDEGS